MKSAPAIAFDFQPSRWIAAGLLVVMSAAVFALMASSLSVPWRIAGGLLVLAYGGRSLWQHLNTPFVRIARRASGWTLTDRDARELPVILRGHWRLGPLLTLELQADSEPGSRRRLRFAFAPDNLQADTRRRLLLILARGENPTST